MSMHACVHMHSKVQSDILCPPTCMASEMAVRCRCFVRYWFCWHATGTGTGAATGTVDTGVTGTGVDGDVRTVWRENYCASPRQCSARVRKHVFGQTSVL